MEERHPSIGEVRGLGAFWAIELVRDRETREMYVPFNPSRADNAPMTELANAGKALGLWPFTHFNRVQATPPCNTSEGDVRHGLAILDEVLEIADGGLPLTPVGA